MEAMRISELARRSGVPASTLRYYEQAGLLPAGRTGAGYRVYGDDAVDRLRFIGTGKQLGLDLAEIAALLELRESGSCAEVKSDLRPRIAGRLAEAADRAAGLRAFSTFLQLVLDRLDALPDWPGHCGPDCESLTVVGPETVGPETAGPETVGAATVGPETAGAATAGERVPEEPAVACSLSGDGRAERGAAWRAAVRDAVREPLAGGVRLTVPPERAAEIAALAVAEQDCCPFFDFRLHFGRSELHLEVRAPAAAAELVAGLFDC